MNNTMAFRSALSSAMLAAMLAAGSALAQVAPQVMTDTAPLPAEDRNSVGAVVLDKSPVRAQRDRDFDPAEKDKRAASQNVGKGIVRATLREQTRAELAKEREARAVEFYQRGAASTTPK